MKDETPKPPLNFIQEIIETDNAARKWGTWPDGRPRVHTRFPPEPNGYLHIGHAKSICLNYGLAAHYGGKFNLRFDDTNPCKEEQEYVDSIVEDVRWLGAKWVGMRDDDPEAGVIFSSDYFQKMHDWAVLLIKKGKAYVCDLTAEETSKHRGTLTRPGTNSPHRARSVVENLGLFERMRQGEFPDGSRTLKAKIDMAHPNINLRDPVMYRILHAEHHRTGDSWCIYPMYDWAHGLEDSIEGITHSICTLEFENHRPLYDWFIDAINEGEAKPIHHPQQIEFARLELTYTVMSKRKLLELVNGGHVHGWDDPRMPTLSGLRRRGYPPEAIRNFCADIGVAKFNSVIEMVRLENAARDYLNKIARRRMAVLRPLRLVIDNWPDAERHEGTRRGGQAPARRHEGQQSNADGGGHVDWLDAVNNPEDASAGTRKVPLSRVLYIERDDFREEPPKGYFRLFPGNEVRLRYAYYIKCTGCVKDPKTGEVVEVHCTHDPATRGGDSPDKRKVKGTIHWVSATHAIDAEVRLYDHLFCNEDPENIDAPHDAESNPQSARSSPAAAGNPQPLVRESLLAPSAARDWKSNLNPNSLEVLSGCKLEPSLADAQCRRDAHRTLAPHRVQFERHGYFCVDPDSNEPGASATGFGGAGVPARRLVFNRTVSLKDSWAKVEKKT